MSFSHLTLAYWCVLVAAALPYVAAWLAKAGAFGLGDNDAPRFPPPIPRELSTKRAHSNL